MPKQDPNAVTREKLVSYIATRPGAVKLAQHGLFSQTDAPIDLNAVASEVANHPGNVWTHVVSLRRDDAQQMGYDTLSAWQELVRRQMPNIAKHMKIDLAHLRWYAAFHDKKNNPHVHIVVYSTDPKEGFLTEQGIEKIRSGFANDIYSDELHHLYEQQTDVRDTLKKDSGELMRQLVEELRYTSIEDEELMQLVLQMNRQLHAAKGKKVYGYLKPEVKQTVDAIFARIAQEPHIREMYTLWCEMEQAKHDMYSSAKVQFPEIQDNPAFKSVKNQIIRTVADMQGTQQPEPVDTPAIQQEPDNAKTIPDDRPESTEEVTVSKALPETTIPSNVQKPFANTTIMALLFDTARLIEASYDRNQRSIQPHADSKLRRAIRRKKRELGIKEDPAEEQKQ